MTVVARRNTQPRLGVFIRYSISAMKLRMGATMLARAMKLMAFVAALAVVGATLADAAKKHKHVKVARTTTAQGQYRGVDKFPAGPLYYNGGEYLGDDPDPNIRFQLWRDLGSHFGGEN
jgi:hypothetical protein